jgi:hypothetical protein
MSFDPRDYNEREEETEQEREPRALTCAQVKAWARRMERENAAYQAAELAAPIADALNGWLGAVAPRKVA